VDDPTTKETEGFGLMFYNARYYDPALGRFVSADSIVPGGAQGLDRFAYVNNSPVNFTDPSGHQMDEGDGGCTSKADCVSVKTPNPSATPVLCPQAAIACLPTPILPTRTPTSYGGPVYIPASTNPVSPSLPHLEIDISDNADLVEMAIDLAGLSADGLPLTALIIPQVAPIIAPIAPIAETSATIAEAAGFIKSVSDIVLEGNPSSMAYQQMTNSAKYLLLFSRFQRLVPAVGVVRNLVSLYINLKPSVRIVP